VNPECLVSTTGVRNQIHCDYLLSTLDDFKKRKNTLQWNVHAWGFNFVELGWEACWEELQLFGHPAIQTKWLFMCESNMLHLLAWPAHQLSAPKQKQMATYSSISDNCKWNLHNSICYLATNLSVYIVHFICPLGYVQWRCLKTSWYIRYRNFVELPNL